MVDLSDDARVYMAPNIRNIALDTLRERTEQRQNRRMLTAIETNQLKQIKLQGMVEKDAAKFTKAIAAAQKKLDQVRELLDKAENDVHLATQLHNQMTLLQQTLG